MTKNAVPGLGAENAFCIVHDMEQRSVEWAQIRVGKLTASNCGKMLATTRSGWSAQRHDLRMLLACEKLTGVSCEIPFTVSAAMQRGIDAEDAAIRAYEGLTGAVVGRVGFLESADGATGCSPDGIVEADGRFGLVEVKCPTTKVHVGYLRSGGVVPPPYQAQLTHSLWVAGPTCEFIDFMSFDDRLPGGLQTFLVREERDEEKITAHADAVAIFLGEIDDEITALEALLEE